MRAAAPWVGVVLIALLAWNLAHRSAVTGPAAADDVARVVLAAALLFAASGFALTRLLLPDGLRRHEALWVLPVGACASSLVLTVLGFLAIPFHVALAITLVAGCVAAVVVLRVRPRAAAAPDDRADWRELAWVSYIVLVAMCIVLIPFFRAGYPTVQGIGQDAHLSAGTAQFLQHHYPSSTSVDGPVDRVPDVWRSKFPIYYALGAVASLSGFETWQAISVLGAFVLALALAGFFVMSRQLLGVGIAGSLAAVGLIGLDRMVIQTAQHPYYNQTWGLFALPWALVAGWWAVRDRDRRALLLFGLFAALMAFAYPLALPFALVPIGVAWWVDRRERRARGEHVVSLSPRRLYHGRRSLLWIVPLVLVLSVPARGVIEKLRGGGRIIFDPRYHLSSWAGDLPNAIPEHEFFSLSKSGPIAVIAIAGILFGAFVALRRVPRPLGIGIGAMLVFAAGLALSFRLRTDGGYLHFKTLAYAAPLAIVCCTATLARLRWVGIALLAIWLIGARYGAAIISRTTFDQTPPPTLALRHWSNELPAGSSIRFDMTPGYQLWAAYFLAAHPLCSQRPVYDTTYPHVPISRAADYVMTQAGMLRPVDAVGRPLLSNQSFTVYRLRAGLPGGDRCSQRMTQVARVR